MREWSEERWTQWLEDYQEAWRSGHWTSDICHADVQFWTPWGNWSSWHEVWAHWGEWNRSIESLNIRTWSHRGNDVLIFWQITWNDGCEPSWGSDWITVDDNHRITCIRQVFDGSSWPLAHQVKVLSAA